MELTAGPRLSSLAIRVRYFSTIERAEFRPDFISFCNSAIVTSSKSAKAGFDEEVEGRVFIKGSKGASPTLRLPITQSCKNFLRSMEFDELFFFRFIEASLFSFSALAKSDAALKI